MLSSADSHHLNSNKYILQSPLCIQLPIQALTLPRWYWPKHIPSITNSTSSSSTTTASQSSLVPLEAIKKNNDNLQLFHSLITQSKDITTATSTISNGIAVDQSIRKVEVSYDSLPLIVSLRTLPQSSSTSSSTSLSSTNVHLNVLHLLERTLQHRFGLVSCDSTSSHFSALQSFILPTHPSLQLHEWRLWMLPSHLHSAASKEIDWFLALRANDSSQEEAELHIYFQSSCSPASFYAAQSSSSSSSFFLPQLCALVYQLTHVPLDVTSTSIDGSNSNSNSHLEASIPLVFQLCQNHAQNDTLQDMKILLQLLMTETKDMVSKYKNKLNTKESPSHFNTQPISKTSQCMTCLDPQCLIFIRMLYLDRPSLLCHFHFHFWFYIFFFVCFYFVCNFRWSYISRSFPCLRFLFIHGIRSLSLCLGNKKPLIYTPRLCLESHSIASHAFNSDSHIISVSLMFYIDYQITIHCIAYFFEPHLCLCTLCVFLFIDLSVFELIMTV